MSLFFTSGGGEKEYKILDTMISGPSKSDNEHTVNSVSAWMCPSNSP